MLIKRLIERIFNQLGLEIIPSWRINSFLLTKRIQKIIKEYQIDCVIDVGANIGQYGEFLRKEVGFKGLIVSFEPDPSNFNHLKEVSKLDKQWIIKNYALGKENSTLNLNIMASSTFNSFLSPTNIETNQFKDQNSVKKTIDVLVRKLDEVLPELKQNHIFDRTFLKLDTQGFDLEVFTGSLGSLDSIYGVQTEVSVLPIYENMPNLEDSLKLFRSNGFEVSGFYPVDETRFPYALEYDCILLSEK